MDNVTGLSAGALEYIILGLLVVSPVVSFFARRTGNKLVHYAYLGLQYVLGFAEKERAKAEAARQAAKPSKPEASPQKEG